MNPTFSVMEKSSVISPGSLTQETSSYGSWLEKKELSKS